MAAPITATPGLEGIVVAQTQLSSVNGTEGILTYRGYNIHDLAENASFEEIMHLLWYGTLPTQSQLDQLNAHLRKHRKLSESVKNTIRALPTTGAPIDSLKAGVTAMGMEDPEQDNLDHDALLEKAIRLAAAMPTMLAMYQRLRTGKEPIEPDTQLGSAANFLYMVNGEKPTETQAKAFDLYLVLLAEHSMNASTFTARSTISSTSDIYSAVTAALGSLKGVAHGGANMMAMNMLIEIGHPGEIDDYVDESLRIKRRLMGLGHRIYKTRDPRVDHLMKWSEKVADEIGDDKWYQLRPPDGGADRPPPVLRRAQALSERRVLLRSAPLQPRLPARHDARRVRHLSHRRLERERHGAVGEQPPDAPGRRVHRPEVAAVRPNRQARLIYRVNNLLRATLRCRPSLRPVGSNNGLSRDVARTG